MRKVLLTSTALVALGGVSAASAIDISGSYMFDYTINDNGTANTVGNNNTAMGSDARINFSGSTTSDSGITFGGNYHLSATGDVEDQGLYMSGDFGYIMAGATDGVVDGMDNFLIGSVTPEVGAGTTNSGTTGTIAAGLNSGAGMTDAATSEKVGYRSPVISGFQFGVSHTDAGRTSKANNNQYMVTYDAGFAKFGYGKADIEAAAGTQADTSQTILGFGTTYGDFEFKYSNGSDKTRNASGTITGDIETSDVGLYYSGFENISLYYNGVVSEQKAVTNSGDKLEYNGVGLSYTIADGVSALIEQGNSDFTDASDATGGGNDISNYTRLGLSVSF